MSRAIVALLTVDAWLTMPPLPFEYQGRDTCPRRVLLVRAATASQYGMCSGSPARYLPPAVQDLVDRARAVVEGGVQAQRAEVDAWCAGACAVPVDHAGACAA